MIFVTHFTAAVNFQFLHNRYIVKRKLHWYSGAVESHQRQRPTPKTKQWWGLSYINCLKVNLVPRIFTEGRPKYRQRPWKRGFVTMESVIDGLKFARAMCSFLFQISVVGQLRFTAIP